MIQLELLCIYFLVDLHAFLATILSTSKAISIIEGQTEVPIPLQPSFLNPLVVPLFVFVILNLVYERIPMADDLPMHLFN